MFGNASLPSRIYSYDCEAPTNTLKIGEQIFKAHKYRNKLVEIELSRRNTIASAQLECYPQLAAITEQIADLQAKIDAARAEIKAKKQKVRGRVETSEAQTNIKAWREEIKPLREQQRAIKSDSWTGEQLRSMIDTIDGEHAAKVRAARAAAVDDGLYWGNYLAAEKSVPRAGRPPKFHRWHFDGKVSVQIQGGMSPEDCHACTDNRLRIQPPDNLEWTNAHRHPDKWTQAMVRIGSEEKGQPIWATVDFCLHRPLPQGCRVKEVYLGRYKTGPITQWKLQFVVAREKWEPKATGSGNIGIDVGWRMLNNGLRVAYWVGDDGEFGQLVLPHVLVNRWSKCSDLQEIRDKRFNAIIVDVRRFIGGLRPIPDWLLEDTKTIHAWRAKGKLIMLIRRWEQNRIEKDADIFAAMLEWRKKEDHLWRWQECNRAKAIRIRNHLYANFVADLRKKYCRAAIEDTNWRDMKRVPAAESDDVKFAGQLSDIAAVGKLLQCVKESMSVTLCDPKHTTKRCHECGHVCDFDPIPSVIVRCDHHGGEFDQDENAAKNLLEMLSGKQDAAVTAAQ